MKGAADFLHGAAPLEIKIQRGGYPVGLLHKGVCISVKINPLCCLKPKAKLHVHIS